MMSEKVLSDKNPDLEQKEEKETIRARFCGFAMGHLILSILLLPVMLLVFSGIDSWPSSVAYLFPILMMGIYFPLGMLVAFTEDWKPPQSTWEQAMAVLQPAALAWIWVVIVLASLWTGEGDLFAAVFGISFLLASPSSFAILFSMGIFPFEMGVFSFLTLGGFAVGLLPPLLFAMGSFWQSARVERGQMKGDRLVPEDGREIE